jgi:hypothetical protein
VAGNLVADRVLPGFRRVLTAIRNHLHAIFLKLDVTDRTQTIAATLGGKQRH